MRQASPTAKNTLSQGNPLCHFDHWQSWQGMPFCQQYRLLYVLRGSGQLTLGETEMPLSAGALCLLAPGNQLTVEWSGECELYVVTFSPLALTEEGISSLTSLCKRLFYVANTPKAAEECLQKLSDAETLREAEKKLLSKLALTELLMHLQLSAAGGEGETENQPLSVRLKQYLDENITAPLPLDELAKRFFVSKYYLCRSFKADFSESVHHYLSRRRVELACRLIARGETASAAAYHVGFGDYSSFYRAYKKHQGQAPSEQPKTKTNEEKGESV